MTASPVIATDRVRVAPQEIWHDAVAVSWRRVKGEDVWHYRFHRTERAAKIAHGKNSRAYDRDTYTEWGWKTIDEISRKAGLWLW
jgi:hypothetical protein